MTITQSPAHGGTYFLNSIPDLVITKTGTESGIDFVLRYGNEDILSENYVYDTDNSIRIRELGSIATSYLKAITTVVNENLLSVTGLISQFSVVITGENAVTHTFLVLKCNADMPAGLDASAWISANFLSRIPREKRTAPNRNEYLSFVSKSAYGALTLHYRLVYDNGTLHEVSGTLFSTIAQADNIIHTINVSPAKIAAAANLSGTYRVLQYDVWITGTGLETNRYTFLPDYSPYRDKTNLVFVNSFGVLETWTATGRTLLKKTNDISLANIEGNYRKTSQDFIKENSLNSGFISDNEMEWLDDILLTDTLGTYKPGTSGMDEEITMTSIEVENSGLNELQGFKVTYRKAKNNHLEFAAAARGIFDETFDETFS